MGDILDYWYEYKTVVPRGFTRFFGKVAELTDKGIDVHWFIGNHDIWIFDYLPDELGVKVHYTPEIVDLNGKTFYLAHGDGLGDTSLTFRHRHIMLDLMIRRNSRVIILGDWINYFSYAVLEGDQMRLEQFEE